MSSASQPGGFLKLQKWHYNSFFLPPDVSGEMHDVVQRVERYIETRDLASHGFFGLASHDRSVLQLWLSQELVMTNAFSQVVLAAASRIANVHVRSILTEVGYGEHGRIRDGVATRAHPWLLHRLRDSVGMDPASIRPSEATVDLIAKLEAGSSESTLSALAWIGVGNERLILPEYDAVEKCFATVWAGADYAPFLQANMTEDMLHSRLCYQAASSLIGSDTDASYYFDRAVESIESRWSYFDQLAAEALDK